MANMERVINCTGYKKLIPMLLTGQSFYMVIHLYPTRKNILSSFATVPDAQWFLFPFWTNYLLLLINQPNLFCFGFTTRQHNL